MGKASSGKKVARAAAAGGGARTGRSGTSGPWKWYALVALVAVLGVALIVTSRVDRQENISNVGPPRPGDHWHVAYGINVCGAFQPELNIERDPQGIHTHAPEGQGDGIVHIHPFTTRASGKNATLGKFAEAAGLELEDGRLTMPDGEVYADGENSCGNTPGFLRVKYAGEIFTEDLADIQFTEDRSLLTIFYGAEDAEIPDPPSAPNLNNLSDVPPEEGGAPTEIPSEFQTEPAPAEGETPPGSETSTPGDPGSAPPPASGEPQPDSTATTAAP